MIEFESLKSMLGSEITCVLSDGKELVTSRERGVKPLVEFIDGGKNFCGYFAADKVVGRAAALLYAYMKINALYAGVISESALEVCNEHGIRVSYGTLVKNIINRRGDGICPMEALTADIRDPSEALDKIKRKLKEMN